MAAEIKIRGMSRRFIHGRIPLDGSPGSWYVVAGHRQDGKRGADTELAGGGF